MTCKQRAYDSESAAGGAVSLAPSAMTKVTVSTENALGSSTSLEQIAELGLKEHWLIPMEHMKPDNDVNSLLGSGGFGIVLKARYHGALVAVRAPLNPDGDSKWFALVAQEVRVFRRLRHPHIVLFYGSIIGSKSSDLWLVMEYVSGTELHKVVGPTNKPGPHYGIRMQLAREVCFALMYLHAQWPPVVHGDVKPSNVLVQTLGKELHAKLADSGMSRLMTQRGKPQGGTHFWVAPEVLLGSTTPEPSSDVFSFGRLFYMTINAKLPPASVSCENQQVMEPTSASTGVPVSTTKSLLWVFEACTCVDPKQRPTMQRVSDHLGALGCRQSELHSPPLEQSFQDVLHATRAAANRMKPQSTGLPSSAGGVLTSL